MFYLCTTSNLSVYRNKNYLFLNFLPQNDGLLTMVSVMYFITVSFIAVVFPHVWFNTAIILTAATITCALLFFVWINTGRRLQVKVAGEYLSVGRKTYFTNYITSITIQQAGTIFYHPGFRRLMGWYSSLPYLVVIEYKGRVMQLPVMLEKASAELTVSLIEKQFKLNDEKPAAVILKGRRDEQPLFEKKTPAILKPVYMETVA